MPCVSARVSEVPTPSDPGTKLLVEFIDLRERVRHERIGRGGLDVSHTLTSALDEAVAAIVDPLPADAAVVALGGYGRRELSLFSDVDLMLLHRLDDPSALAAELFRPLWDAKLRVGHSVRNLSDVTSAAKERFDTHTTLLTARLVAGDTELFDALTAQVSAVTRARPLRRHLVAAERNRRASSPFLLMATDVKNGRGGLRTLQGFEWERRRESLIGRFTTDSRPEEEEARESLLEVRNALHAAAGRSHDVFSADLREPAARWLGVDIFDMAKRLVTAIHITDDLATQRWPEIVEQDRPLRRRVWSRATGVPRRLSTEQASGLETIVWMLESGERGRVSFERLWESGALEDVLPEWGVVRSLPQLAHFHEHPVDAHLWRTVAEMQQIISDGGRYQSVATDLSDQQLTLLAAFLHDIGKGHGGDHATVGAAITAHFCKRVAISDERAELLVGAVKHHLLLAETATRRDLDDPAVLSEVALEVGSADQLRLLYLLTVADSRATGPAMWTEWKATLLRTLFTRCLALLDDGIELPHPGTTRELVLDALDYHRRSEAERHLAGLGEGYLRGHSTDDVLWHLDVVAGLRGSSSLSVLKGSPVETAVVAGESPGRLRRIVAEAFAANGIDVLEARINTRADGLVIDTFRIRDDRTGGSVPAERWGRVRHDIDAAMSGELDIWSKMNTRASAYESSAATKPRVECSVDSASGDIVVLVKCSDRVGRLAEILAALGRADLEVRLAKLDSRGDELVDTFHVGAGDDVSAEELDRLALTIESGIST